MRFINDKQQPPKSTLKEIQKGTEAKLNESDTVLLQIIGRLEKDNFIKIEHDIINVSKGVSFLSVPTPITYYLISFDGAYLLKHQDGYVGRENQRLAENIRLDTLTNRQIANDEALTQLTRLIAWGTVGATAIGVLLLIWQIFSFCYSYYHPLPNPCVIIKKFKIALV